MTVDPVRTRAAVLAGVATFLVIAPAVCAGVADFVDRVSASQYRSYHLAVESSGLGYYGGVGYDMGYRNRDGTAGPGTLGNQECRLYLRDHFNGMGLDVTEQGVYRNVIAELPGVETPENIYIVCGHYDHVAGDKPGGDDNASGTAVVLEAARVLSRLQFRSTIRFIGFNAEEDGMLGSTHYVDNVVVPGGEHVLGVINLDMILRPAHDHDAGWTIDLDLAVKPDHTPSATWAAAFQQAAAAYVPSLNVDPVLFQAAGRWGYSDHVPFANAGYPAFLAIENNVNEISVPGYRANEYYHTYEDATDRLANNAGPTAPSASGVAYDYGFAVDVTRAAVALLAEAAEYVPFGGDADTDGRVDMADYAVWLDHYGSAGGWEQADFNDDQIVDMADYATWFENYGAGGVQGVPEPTVLCALVLGAMGATHRRPHRRFARVRRDEICNKWASR